MLKEAARLIKNSKRISLITHRDPDGDALGSLLGLSTVIKKLSKEPHPVARGPIPSNFSYMTGLKMLKTELNEKCDLLILLDFSDSKRSCVSPKEMRFYLKQIPSILIDHHPPGDLTDFCSLKIQSLSASATAEILYSMINYLSVTIDREIASYLFTGIFTDTNGFQNPNTSRETLNIVASLVATGIRIEKIIKHILSYESVGVLKLWGKAMKRLWQNKKYNLLITLLTEQDFLDCGVEKETARGIINFLNVNYHPTPNAILLLIEKNGKIKGSLRTQKTMVDVGALSQLLGGGGHKKAAAFELEGKITYQNGRWLIV